VTQIFLSSPLVFKGSFYYFETPLFFPQPRFQSAFFFFAYSFYPILLFFVSFFMRIFSRFFF